MVSTSRVGEESTRRFTKLKYPRSLERPRLASTYSLSAILELFFLFSCFTLLPYAQKSQINLCPAFCLTK